MKTKTLTLIRGLPGSGKSTLAKKMVAEAPDLTTHLEADMFFTTYAGNYMFNPSYLGIAHKWCKDTADIFLRNGVNVIVSNTFTTMRELTPYIAMADDADAYLNIIVLKGTYGNIHNVPKENINAMQNRWEHCVGEEVRDPWGN